MASKDESTLDIFALTVRAIINETQEEGAESIIETLQPDMLKGIEAGSAACKAECLDVCTDLFKRFGLFMLRKQSLLNRD